MDYLEKIGGGCLRSIFIILLREIAVILKDYKRIFIMMLLPVIIISFMSIGFKYLFQQGVYIDKFNIVVVNEDQHPLASFLMQQIQEDKNLEALLDIEIMQDAIQAENQVRNNLAVAAVVIPEGFVHSLETGTNHSVKLITNRAHPLKSHMIQSIMNSYMKSVSGGQSAVNAVWDYYKNTDMTYEERSKKIDWVINDITLSVYFARNNVFEKNTIKGVNSLSSFEFYLASGIIIFIMFSSLSGAKTLLEEKDSKIIHRIKMTGISGFDYIVGKFAAIYIIGMMQSFLIFTIGAYFLLGGLQREYFYILLLYLTIIFSISSLSLLTAVMIKSRERLESIGSITVLLMTFIGGGIIPYIYLPNFLQILSKLTINYWSLKGLLGFLEGVPIKGITSILLLAAVGTISLLLTCHIFNKREGWGNQ